MSNAVVAPTRERLAAIAEAVEAAPKIGRRSVGVELGELRWLLAQAGRLDCAEKLLREYSAAVEARRRACKQFDELRRAPKHQYEKAGLAMQDAFVYEALVSNKIAAFLLPASTERRLLAPPPQPSTSTSSPPVEATTPPEHKCSDCGDDLGPNTYPLCGVCARRHESW